MTRHLCYHPGLQWYVQAGNVPMHVHKRMHPSWPGAFLWWVKLTGERIGVVGSD